jgi:hypothetical protein
MEHAASCDAVLGDEADALSWWRGHHRLPDLWSAQPGRPDRLRIPPLPEM